MRPSPFLGNQSRVEEVDDRFYTPRASANSSRSQHSQSSCYATPRSARSASSSESFRTPRSTFSSRSPAIGVRPPRNDNRRLPHGSQRSSVPSTIVGGHSLPPSRHQEYDRAEAGLRRSQPEPTVNIFSLVRHGRVGQVEELLLRGVPIDTRDENGNGILAIACQNGSKKLVKLALRYGADPNAVNNTGNSALHFACRYGFGATLGDYLVSKGANPDIRNHEGLRCTDV